MDDPKTPLLSEKVPILISKEVPNKMTPHESPRSLACLNMSAFTLWYILLYSGFWGLSTLQSTMNGEQGLGPMSQAVMYFFSALSSLLVPGAASCKLLLVVGSLVCCAYVAANARLRADTLVLTSALFGLIQGPFSSAQALYVDRMARAYGGNLDHTMAVFFGIYALSIEGSTAIGNLVSYLILTPRRKSHHNRLKNVTASCGVGFISPDEDEDNRYNFLLEPPPELERVHLISILLVMGLTGTVLIMFYLDSLRTGVKSCDREDQELRGYCGNAWSCFALLGNPQQILLVPLTVYVGVESVFYANEFTEAYIACSWGVHHVGFVTVCFGVCGAVMALLVGPLVKCVSQMAVLLLAAAANAVTCALLFFWTPSPDSVWEYFVFAGVWGVGDAIWWSQVTALYGLMFPNDREAAFSNLYFWSFLGFFLSYSYANYFSVAVKISILLAFLGFGILGYLIGQIKLKCYSSHRHEYLLISDEQ